jgi:hypothetical protein
VGGVGYPATGRKRGKGELVVNVYVLTRDAGNHNADMHPVGVFSDVASAQEAAQSLETDLITWYERETDIAGKTEASVYARYEITEVPMNDVTVREVKSVKREITADEVRKVLQTCKNPDDFYRQIEALKNTPAPVVWNGYLGTLGPNFETQKREFREKHPGLIPDDVRIWVEDGILLGVNPFNDKHVIERMYPDDDWQWSWDDDDPPTVIGVTAIAQFAARVMECANLIQKLKDAGV